MLVKGKSGIIASLLIFIFAIPLVLNFILPIRTGLVIMGDPKIWLSFWASYLAAIGSFVVAFVSLEMNKRLHKQNEKNINYQKWDKMVERYNRLERFIVNEEHLHSEWTLCFMLNYAKIHEETEIELFFSKKAQEFFSCVLNIARFQEQEMAYNYTTQTGKNFYLYGKNVSKINNESCTFFKRELNKGHSKEEWVKRIGALIEENRQLLDKLEDKRMEYLLSEKMRIIKFADKHHLDVHL